jgi:bacterioferritin (cytochrome b1)
MDRIEKAIGMLNEVLKRKMNSAAGYVLESSPYATDADGPAIEAIEALSATARRHAEEAARRILLLEGVPHGGSYDPSIADSNYLSARYLLRPLLARLEQDIALFEEYRERCQVLEARDFLTMVIEDDKIHRDQLRALREQFQAKRSITATHEP